MKILDILNSPWAISKSSLTQIARIYTQHLNGDKLDFKSFHDSDEMFKKKEIQVVNNKAIIPVKGVLTPSSSFFDFFFDSVGMDTIKKNIQMAVDNRHDVILDTNTPGGTVEASFELADFIEMASKKINIVGFSDGKIASAGMLVVSSSKKIFITGKTNQIGSIGVIATIHDFTKMNESQGLNVEEFVSGKFKNIGSEDKEITDFDRETMQGMVDKLFSLFAEDFARRRGIDIQKIIDMEAKIFIGQEAIDNGLVDGVSTLEQLIEMDFNKLGSKQKTIIRGGEMSITLDKLKSENPDLYNSIVNNAKKEGESSGVSEGAKKEQERVLAIQNCAFPGMEKLTEKLIKDGVTAGDAALMFNQMEKKRATVALSDIVENAPEQVQTPDAVTSTPAVKKNELKEGSKDTYNASTDLQNEFGDFETYSAYFTAKNNNQIRTFGQK